MKTERKLLELEKELYQINKTYNELVKELHKEETAQEIDFERIVAYSKRTAFFGHYISDMDSSLSYQFFRHLAGAVSHLQNREKKIRQYYFLARLLAASNHADFELEDIIMDARLISSSDFELLSTTFNQEEKLIFLITFLLMISFDGMIEDMQMDYFCEISALFTVNRDTLQQIFHTVKGILTAQEQFFDYADKLPLNSVSCFLPNNRFDYIVTHKSEIASCTGDRIIVCGISFKNKALNIDKYKKQHITFRNCSFEKMHGLTAEQTSVTFKNCRFIQCNDSGQTADTSSETTKTLFSFKQADFSACHFEDCETTGKKGFTILLEMEQGEILGSTFKNCKASDEGVHTVGDDRWSCASLIRTGNVTVRDCQFLDCSAYSNNHYFLRHIFTDNQCMHIITSVKGCVEFCKFENCRCIESQSTVLNNANRYYYLINAIKADANSNMFINCDAKKDTGTINWTYSS